MSNVFTANVFGFFPVATLPYSQDHEWWNVNEDRAAYIADLRTLVEKGEYSVTEEPGSTLLRLVGNENGGSYMLLVKHEDAAEEECPCGESHDSSTTYAIYGNGDFKGSVDTLEEANSVFDHIVEQSNVDSPDAHIVEYDV